MKKILIIAISLLLTTSLFAQTLRIATFPFTGSVVTSTEEGEFLAGLFTSEFIPLGYTLVTRTTGLGVSAAERDYQTSGATAEIAEIGKQVAADYVLVGALNTVFGQMSLKVEVIGVESSQIVASETQRIDSLDDLTTVSEEMVKSLNSQIQGTSLSPKTAEAPKAPKIAATLEGFTTLTADELIMRDLEKFKKGKWTGRWIWIGGTALEVIGVIAIATQSPYPDQYDYGFNTDNYDQEAYERAREDYSSSNIVIGITALTIGSAAIIAGVITDIVFSVRENNLLKDLESQGIYLSATPTIKPDLVSGTMNYGVQLGLKYNF